MSAIEFLLTSHVAANDIHGLAVAAGITGEDVERQYGTRRVQGWAALYVQAVGVGSAWSEASRFMKWGNGSLYDFPLADDITWGGLHDSLATLVEARGNVFEEQAYRGPSTEPQVAFARKVSDRLFILVVDEVARELLPRLGVGMEAYDLPTWTLCALSTRGSWRLETYATGDQSRRIAKALARQLGLRFAIDEPHNVHLILRQLDRLIDALKANLRARQVLTREHPSGVRKVRGEAGSAVADIRRAMFYKGIQQVADEADFDTIVIPWDDNTYRLQMSRDGSFWFRAYTPRDLIDKVLREAEEIVGV